MDLRARRAALGQQVSGAIARVLDHDRFVLGPEVEQFEREFAAYCGVRHAIGVGNGTDALTLSLIAAGVTDGSEVVLPANSFAATAEAVVHAGGRPVFVDVDEESLLMEPSCAVTALTLRTRAIVPVHLYGSPASIERLAPIAASRNISIIEDAAQAHGAMMDGRRAGSVGLTGCFSFYPSKNLGGIGDGGIVVTDNDAMADSIRIHRDHGSRGKYDHEVVGFNSRLDTIQAAVLLEYLPHLDAWNAARQGHAASYQKLLGDLDGVKLPSNDDSGHVFHLFVLRLRDVPRDDFRKFLEDREIETGVHYPVPLHLTPAFAGLGFGPGAFPVAEAACETVVSLPMYPELTEDQVEYVADSVREFFRGA